MWAARSEKTKPIKALKILKMAKPSRNEEDKFKPFLGKGRVETKEKFSGGSLLEAMGFLRSDGQKAKEKFLN